MIGDTPSDRTADRSWPEVPLALAGPTDGVLTAIGDAPSLLTAAERGRADAFRSARDRRDYVAAHALVRTCAARLAGTPPSQLTLLQRCRQCGGAHGRPTLLEAPRLSVSLSHTTGYVAAMAGFDPVGIDVEDCTRLPDLAAARLTLTALEEAAVMASAVPRAAFLRQWVRKETFVKLGVVAIDDLQHLDLSDLPMEVGGPAGDGGIRSGTRAVRWDGWHLLEWWDAAAGVVGSAASRELPTLVTFDEPAPEGAPNSLVQGL
jgi:4'-phosphopantetheinyl transferase